MTPREQILGQEQQLLQQLLEDDAREHSGSVIGSYTLVEQLGEGGFGIVWRARQSQPVQRDVALKVIKPGMDSVRVLARFDMERQALATMEHPHIARLHEAGSTTDGRPFFAMELVNGKPITRWCKARKLPWRERLPLFLQVCAAVQHAHQKGIIHRDLKPTNILVTESGGTPVPKLIDFGIAKAVAQTTQDHGLMTQHDMFIGTPLYMAPEQLAGTEVDTRTDIYALGVVLYELLADVPPFDADSLASKSLDEVKRMLREQTPPRPSTRANAAAAANRCLVKPMPAGIDADLDWITMRALEKDPERRYASVAEFAADITRFLADEPVSARPPSFAYLSMRWLCRHRVAFAAASVCVLALVAGSILALSQARIARTAQAVAEANERRAHEHETRAMKAEAEAKQQGLRHQQTAGFVTKLLDSIAREVIAGRNPEALRLALEKSHNLLDDMPDDPALRIELLGRLASLWQKMGERKPALAMRGERADLMSRMHGEHSEEAREARMDFIKLTADHGDRGTAIPELEKLKQGVEAHEGKGGKFWFEVQRQLVRVWVKLERGTEAVAAAAVLMQQARESGLTGRSLFSCLISQETAYEAARQFDEAEAVLGEARQLAAGHSLKDELNEAIDERLMYLCISRPDHVRGAQVQSQIIARLQKKHGATSAELVEPLGRLIAFETGAGRHDAAIAHAQEVLAIAMKHETKGGRSDVCRALRYLTAALSAAKRHDEAISRARECLTRAEELGNSSELAKAWEHLGNACHHAGRLDEAYHFYELNLRDHERRAGSYVSQFSHLRPMIDVRLAQGRPADALQLALSLWRKTIEAPSSADRPAYLADIATYGMKAWDALRAKNATAPEPNEVKAWQAAMRP